MAPDTTAERRAWRNTLKRKICSRTDFANNAQYVHTPYDLCHNMVERLDQYGSLHAAQTFLTFNLEFVEVLCYTYGIEKSKVWFVTECLEKAAVALRHPRYKGINVVIEDYLTWKAPNNMKFDVIVGNPPYQGTGRKKLHIEFIAASLDRLEDGGMLTYVVPKIAINFLLGHEINQKTLPDLYDIKHIDISSGVAKQFDVGSDFCSFVVKKSPYSGKTMINTDNGLCEICLESGMFLPFENVTPLAISVLNKLAHGGNQLGRKAARIEKDLHDTPSPSCPNKILYKILTHDNEYKYTSVSHEDFGSPKVLFPTVGARIIQDERGELFPGTSFVVYVKCPAEHQKHLVWFVQESKAFKYVERSFSTMRSPRDYALRNMRTIDFSKPMTDADVYKYFKLTAEEIALIEAAVK